MLNDLFFRDQAAAERRRRQRFDASDRARLAARARSVEGGERIGRAGQNASELERHQCVDRGAPFDDGRAFFSRPKRSALNPSAGQIDPPSSGRGEDPQRHVVGAGAEEFQPAGRSERLEPCRHGLFGSEPTPQRKLGLDQRSHRGGQGIAFEFGSVQNEQRRRREPGLSPERRERRASHRRSRDHHDGGIEGAAFVDRPCRQLDRLHRGAGGFETLLGAVAPLERIVDDENPRPFERAISAWQRAGTHPAERTLVKEHRERSVRRARGQVEARGRDAKAGFDGDGAAFGRQDAGAAGLRETSGEPGQIARARFDAPDGGSRGEVGEEVRDLRGEGGRRERAIELGDEAVAGARTGCGSLRRNERHERDRGGGEGELLDERFGRKALFAAKYDQIGRSLVGLVDERFGGRRLHAHAASTQLDLGVALADVAARRPEDEVTVSRRPLLRTRRRRHSTRPMV